MTKETNIKLFEEKKVRSIWDSEQEKWLRAKGNETVTNCLGLKMLAADGKMRLTDVAGVEQFFRIIQF